MSRREIIAGIFVVIGSLALAAVLSRRNPSPSPTSFIDEIVPPSFDVVRSPDRFTDRTAPKEGPEEEIVESGVIFFPEAKESDGGESADDEDDHRSVIRETPSAPVEPRSDVLRRRSGAYDPIDPKR